MTTPLDNGGTAPIIPAGTEPTVFGTRSFTPEQSGFIPGVGQVGNPPAQQSQVQSNAPIQTNAPSGTTFAELAAKKGFKTPDDLAKSYEELERRKTQVEMGMSDLLKVREIEVSPQISQPPVVNPQDEALKIVEGIARRVVKPLEDRVALQELFRDNPDAKDFAPQIANVLKENPSLSWSAAYKLAKYDALEKTAREQGRQEAYGVINQKQSAQAGSSRPTVRASSDDIRNVIKDKNVPFSEVQRIMKERFNL